MNKPEPVSWVELISRLLGCGTAVAVMVADRARRDPEWARRDEPGAFARLTLKHFFAFRERALDRGERDPIDDLVWPEIAIEPPSEGGAP